MILAFNDCPLEPKIRKCGDLSIVHSFHSDLKTYDAARDFCETEASNGFTSGRLFEPMRKSQNDLVYAESIRQFGGLKNTEASGYTGDVNLTLPSRSSNPTATNDNSVIFGSSFIMFPILVGE